MPRIRPLGQCEECHPEEGLKEIVSHGLCAKHNQRRLRAIWRKPEPSETQKQKLMEKLEKDLIAIKNMCSRWERDGYVAMELITPETIETLRTELDDYMDFRPTLKAAAQPKTALEQALAGYKAPPPMFDDEDAETASKKSAPGQYQFAPVADRPAMRAAAAAPKRANESSEQANSEQEKVSELLTEPPSQGSEEVNSEQKNASELVHTRDYKLPPAIGQDIKKIKQTQKGAGAHAATTTAAL
jgi:hypothetical protein